MARTSSHIWRKCSRRHPKTGRLGWPLTVINHGKSRLAACVLWNFLGLNKFKKGQTHVFHLPWALFHCASQSQEVISLRSRCPLRPLRVAAPREGHGGHQRLAMQLLKGLRGSPEGSRTSLEPTSTVSTSLRIDLSASIKDISLT